MTQQTNKRTNEQIKQHVWSVRLLGVDKTKPAFFYASLGLEECFSYVLLRKPESFLFGYLLVCELV